MEIGFQPAAGTPVAYGRITEWKGKPDVDIFWGGESALFEKLAQQKLLKKVNEALDRMKNQTYGICEQCGEDIPYKRLKARPVTTFCIECKTLQEQKERGRR